MLFSWIKNTKGLIFNKHGEALIIKLFKKKLINCCTMLCIIANSLFCWNLFSLKVIQFYVVYRIKSIYLQLNKAYSDRCPIVVIMHASFHLLHFFQSHNSIVSSLAVDSFPGCVYSRNISRLWTRLFLVFSSVFPGQSGEAILVLVGWIFDHRHKAFHRDRVNMLSDLWSKFLPSLLTL